MLLPSQVQLLRKETAGILAVAKDCGLKGGEFNERVEELKHAEAVQINNDGIAAQIEYIVASYGFAPEQMQKALRDLKEVIMDYAPKGKLCRCSQCQADEFRSLATKHGEGWLCQKCMSQE